MAPSLPRQVDQVLRRVFPVRRQARARSLLETRGAGQSAEVLCAALDLSGGSLRKLGRELELAALDSRDVVVGLYVVRLRKDLARALRDDGVRVGPARMRVIQALTWTPGLAFSRAELAQRVGQGASPPTIDATLQRLQRLGWIQTVHDGKAPRFVIRRKRTSH